MNKIVASEILINKKAVFFDMDGVLYDSMGAHADAWSKAFHHFGIDFPPEMVYQNEGRTAQSTINLVYQQNEKRKATDLEIDQIYSKKTELIADYPDAIPFDGVRELMESLKNKGIGIWVVTGSSQDKFLDALLRDFEGLITAERIISGNDVKHGKPNPEPYLTALEKSRISCRRSYSYRKCSFGDSGLESLPGYLQLQLIQAYWTTGSCGNRALIYFLKTGKS